MTLDQQTADILARLSPEKSGSSVDEMRTDIEAVREGSRSIFRAVAGPDDMSCLVERLSISGAAEKIPLRLYRQPGSNGPLPIVIFLHGGGWSVGDLESYDGLVRSLCALSGAIFISVDYRLAPEHKFPAGLEDGLAATEWAFANAAALGGSASRIAIMGDSAGGNLSTVIAHRLHSTGKVQLAAQFLLYPMLDVSKPHYAYGSRMEFGNGNYLLSREDIDLSVAWYLDNETDASDPEISPLLAESLNLLPPTFVMAAGHDPLLDEARLYANNLEAAGVPTVFKCYDGAIHAFLSFGVLEIAQEARTYLATKIKELLFESP